MMFVSKIPTKMVLLLFVLVVSFTIPLRSQSIVQIGTNQDSSSVLIFGPSYHYSTAQLYKESEMQGKTGYIKSVSFYTGFRSLDYWPGQSIFMGIYPDSSFSSSAPIPLYNQFWLKKVYGGNTSWGLNIWKKLYFREPFAYNGGTLLLLYISQSSPGSWPPTLNHHYSPQSNMVKTWTYNGSATLRQIRSTVRFEFVPFPANDLELESILSPKDTASINQNNLIKVRVINRGTMPQHSFKLKYSFEDGSASVTENVTYTILPNDTLDYTFNTPLNISKFGRLVFKAEVVCPGDTMDENDQKTRLVWLGTTFNGSYTVGFDANDDFHSIALAADLLNRFKQTGPVILLLDDTVFTETIRISNSYANMLGSLWNVTFKGHGENTIIKAPDFDCVKYFQNSSRDVVINRNKVIIDSIRFDHKLRSPNLVSLPEIGIIEIQDADSVTIKNCIFNIPENDYDPTSAVRVNNHSRNVTINNNQFNYGHRAVDVIGTQYGYDTSIVITNNIINNVSREGIRASYVYKINISNNYIKASEKSDVIEGIDVRYSKPQIIINNNKLDLVSFGIARGIWISYVDSLPGDTNYIVNNSISIPDAQIAEGIYLRDIGNLRILNNSVYIKPKVSMLVTNNSAFSLPYIYSGSNNSNIQILNNNFVNMGKGLAFRAHQVLFPSIVSVCDYNNYYSAGQYLVRYDSLISSLSSWKAAVPLANVHSKSVYPGYLTSLYLKPSSSLMSNSGTPTNNPYDISDSVRNTVSPDIGAYEYSPLNNDASAVEFVDLNQKSCNAIKLVLLNNGNNTISSIPIAIKIDTNAAITINQTVNLQSMQRDTITITNTQILDLITQGWHDIVVYSMLSGDQNLLNDTVRARILNAGNIGTFPFYENFESLPDKISLVTSIGTHVKLTDEIEETKAKGLLFRGAELSNGVNGQISTVTQAFLHEDQIGRARFCNIIAPSQSALMLKMDMKIFASKHSPNNTSSWFRVMVNDSIYVKSINNDSTWKGVVYFPNNPNPLQTLFLDLSPFAGTSFKLTLEAYCEVGEYHLTGYNYYRDIVFIDNLSLFVSAQYDLGVSKIIRPKACNCGVINDSIEVQIANNGSSYVDFFPVTIEVTPPNGVSYSITEFIYDSIPAYSKKIYTLNSTLNLKQPGDYHLKIYTQLNSDLTSKQEDTSYTVININSPINPLNEKFEYIANWYTAGYTANDYRGGGNTGFNLVANNTTGVYWLPLSQLNDVKELEFVRPIVVDTNVFLSFDFVAFTSYVELMGISKAYTYDFEQDSLIVMISKDCGLHYLPLFVVDSSNYKSSFKMKRFNVSMSSNSGKNIMLKFVGKRDHYSSLYAASYCLDNITMGKPDLDLGPDTAVCVNSELILDAGVYAGCSYLWLFGNDTIGFNQTQVADSAGTYIVKVYNLGSVFYDTINVSFNPLSNLSFSSLPSVFCENDTAVNLQVSPSGGVFVGAGVNGNVFNPSIAGLGTHIVEYYYTNQYYCIASVSDTTFVNPKPQVSTSSLPSSICQNSTAVALSGLPSGGVFGGDGVIGNTFNPTVAGPGTKIIYYSFTNQYACTDSAFDTTKVIESPEVFLGNDTTIKWSWDIALDAGNPSAIYLWSTGATSQIINLDSNVLNFNSPTIIWVNVFEQGCSTTDTIIITTINDVSITPSWNNVEAYIYPNPNKGSFNLGVKGYTGEVEVEVFDLNGKLVYKTAFDVADKHIEKIDASILNKGLYQIKIKSKDGYTIKQLIIY